jgi:hypothetical protein
MYVSRAVKSLRADPIEGESVALALTTVDGADRERIVTAVTDAGGTVERRLQFDDLAVSIPHDRIDDLCAIDGLDAIETTAAIAITTTDATDEDVTFDE